MRMHHLTTTRKEKDTRKREGVGEDGSEQKEFTLLPQLHSYNGLYEENKHRQTAPRRGNTPKQDGREGKQNHTEKKGASNINKKKGVDRPLPLGLFDLQEVCMGRSVVDQMKAVNLLRDLSPRRVAFALPNMLV